MTSQYRHRRSSNPATVFPNPLEPGEIAVNTANRQIAVGDGASGVVGTPLPLLALRYFDVRAQYVIGDFVIQAGVIYRANTAVSPGAFNVAQWDLVTGAVNPLYVLKSGSTMTGQLVLAADPGAPMEAGTKQYIDGKVAAKSSVIVSDTMPSGVIDATLWFESDTGILYVRYNDGNTTQWVIACPQPDISQFVNRSGDTMTGPLITQTPSQGGHAANKNYVDAADLAKVSRAGDSMTGTLTMGGTGAIVVTSPNGINAGPGGLAAGAAGVITTGDVRVGSAGNTGTYYFGQTGFNRYINYDGTNFSFVGGPFLFFSQVYANRNLQVGDGSGPAALVFNGNPSGPVSGAYTVWQKNAVTSWYFGHVSAIMGGSSTSNNFMFYSAAGKSALELDYAIGQVIINPNAQANVNANCALKVMATGGAVQYGLGMQVATDNTSMLYFCNSAGTNVGRIDETATGIAYVTSSSGELKEDLKSFDAGNIIDATSVYDFKWKSTGERDYGIIAQKEVEVYPAAIFHSKQDGSDEPEFWGVDYSKYVPVLLQELKALRSRVRQLETDGGIAPKGGARG